MEGSIRKTVLYVNEITGYIKNADETKSIYNFYPNISSLCLNMRMVFDSVICKDDSK